MGLGCRVLGFGLYGSWISNLRGKASNFTCTRLGDPCFFISDCEPRLYGFEAWDGERGHMKLAKYSGTALEGMLSRLVRPLGLRQVLGPSLGFFGGALSLHGFMGSWG